MATYPHVGAVSNVGPMDGDGPEASFVTATTTFGGQETNVHVYWSDPNDGESEPRLVIDIAGSAHVRVEYNDRTVFATEDPKSKIDSPVRLASLSEGKLFRLYANAGITYRVEGHHETGVVDIRSVYAYSDTATFSEAGSRLVYPL